LETKPLICFDGLSKTFGRGQKSVEAVIDLDLEISPGQVYGFLGQNGAGKTTTIRLLLGLIHPTRGRALISGQDVQVNPRVLRAVGSIVEDPGFYNFMSGRDNLLTLSYTTGEKPTHRLDQLLDQVGLSARASQNVSGYSKGMRQRLGLAAALLSDPELIILDEPTNGLDPKGMLEMRALIRELVEIDGKTVFISSHLLNEVEQVCDRVAIIHQGRIVQEGEVSELLSGLPGQLRIQASPLPQALTVLEPNWQASVDSQSEDTDRPWIQVDAPPDSAPDIIRRLVKAGVEVHQVEAHKQSLEELFLEVTEEESSHE
jgi:ABC-2 type transport system ATP-binding protein